jgi:hypothetical protein
MECDVDFSGQQKVQKKLMALVCLISSELLFLSEGFINEAKFLHLKNVIDCAKLLIMNGRDKEVKLFQGATNVAQLFPGFNWVLINYVPPGI